MPVERYFTDSPLKLHATVILDGQEFHHLVHVMRTRPGANVELVNGKGTLASAVALDISKKQAQLKIVDSLSEDEPSPKIILAQAIPRPSRLDFILEKGTELGMSQIWLFPAKRSEKKKFSESQKERMRAIVIAAMKQCGRLYLPEIYLKPHFETWSKEEHCLYLFGDLSPEAIPFRKIEKEKHVSKIVFFIGPESGFDATEEKTLKNMGAIGVKLHKHTLRTDTASLVALSQIQHWFL
jgi:16S rRNA (uracil1498-N3)-methyltransferase